MWTKNVCECMCMPECVWKRVGQATVLTDMCMQGNAGVRVRGHTL